MKKDGNDAKKQWYTPELISLTRTNPEETVLMGCNACTTPPTSGPSNGSAKCVTGPQPSCFNCYKS